MALTRLNSRFLLANCLLVATTVASGAWSALTFARLGRVVDSTIQQSEETTSLAAIMGTALEREDDALLLCLHGDPARGRGELAARRDDFERSYPRLLSLFEDDSEREAARVLRTSADAYRRAGDELLGLVGQPTARFRYDELVNPALRKAVAACGRIREINFRQMQQASIRARDEARRGTWLLAVISFVALVLSTAVTVHLTRTVVSPIRNLTRSVEALGLGRFDSRVSVESVDELGQLARGFNKMAGSLAEFHRLNVGEVVKAKETLEATLAALPDAVFVIDPDGRIAAMNTEAGEILRARGSPPPENMRDLPLTPEWVKAVEGSLRGERRVEGRADLEKALVVSREGRTRRFLPVVVPVPDRLRERHGAVLVLNDVTDFARLDELRAEMIAIASHELKNPLTTLRMNLLLLGERAERLAPQDREVVAAAVQGCEELSRTVDELLDLTRVEAGQLRLNLDRVELRLLVEQAVRAMRPRFEDAGVSLELSCEERPLPARVDAGRMNIVLSNLLTNALKYTPREGRVNVRVASRQNAGTSGTEILQIAVTDTGPGVPVEFRERVFEKFFRVEHHLAGAEGRPPGTGVGLYLCRQILEAHGGRVRCEAGDEGRGARVVLELGADPS